MASGTSFLGRFRPKRRRDAVFLAIAVLAVLSLAWLVGSGLPAFRAQMAHPWISQCMAQPPGPSASSFFIPPLHPPPGRFCLNAPSQDASLGNAPEGGRAFAEVRDLTRIEVWDGQRHRYFLLEGHTGRVRCFAVSGTWLLTASDEAKDTPVRLWSLETGALLRTFDARQPACWGGFGFMGFSKDRRFAVTATADRRVRVWDAQTGTALAVLDSGEGATQFAMSPDRRLLALGGFSGNIQIWGWRTGTLLRSWHAHDPFGRTTPDGGGIEWLQFSPDGTRLESYGPFDGKEGVLTWNPATGTLMRY